MALLGIAVSLSTLLVSLMMRPIGVPRHPEHVPYLRVPLLSACTHIGCRSFVSRVFLLFSRPVEARVPRESQFSASHARLTIRATFPLSFLSLLLRSTPSSARRSRSHGSRELNDRSIVRNLVDLAQAL